MLSPYFPFSAKLIQMPSVCKKQHFHSQERVFFVHPTHLVQSKTMSQRNLVKSYRTLEKVTFMYIKKMFWTENIVDLIFVNTNQASVLVRVNSNLLFAICNLRFVIRFWKTLPKSCWCECKFVMSHQKFQELLQPADYINIHEY